MHPDRDFDLRPAPLETLSHFAKDLELGILLGAACRDDHYLHGILSAVMARAWGNDSATIHHRQEVLRDCIRNNAAVRNLFALASEPFGRRTSWDFALYGTNPSAMVGSSVRTLRSSLGVLRRIRDACRSESAGFASRGFQQFFATLEQNLDDTYLKAAERDLDRLIFRSGVVLSAQVGPGGKGVDVRLRVPQPRDLSWLRRMTTPGPRSFTFRLDPRDLAGAQAYTEFQNRGLGLISDSLWRSAHHVLGFLKVLRAELGFYVSCLNLHEELLRAGETITYPEPKEEERSFECRELRDVCLSLTMKTRAGGNDADANGKPLIIVTGVNRGGKSTFLRSVGLALLMLQCGMFVTADRFASSLHTGLFTHFKREEDRGMESGKLDEELARMSGIADKLRRGGAVLFNESFAATNEREGSEVARQITSALLAEDVAVFYVSHMYDFARSFAGDNAVLFLRADRDGAAGRDFRLREGAPTGKSFGVDLYRKVFAE